MAEARQRILAAADELFGEQGFDATTTRQIAERSGANKALMVAIETENNGIKVAGN